MSVSVRIPTILRTYTGGQAEVTAEGGTLAEVISDLEKNHAGISARVLDDQGKLRRFVNVYVNDDDVRFEQGLETATPDGAASRSFRLSPAAERRSGGPRKLPWVTPITKSSSNCPLRERSGGGNSVGLSGVQLGNPLHSACRTHMSTRSACDEK